MRRDASFVRAQRSFGFTARFPAYYRLREAEGWLEHMLGRVLAGQAPQVAGRLRADGLSACAGKSNCFSRD
jgi:hypothetical protein